MFRKLALIALVLVCAVGAAHAAQVPLLFGPESYERTDAPSDDYTAQFDVPVALNAMVWIQNGDGDGNRTSSASITINGVQVAGPADFTKAVDLIAKSIALPKGSAALDVQMTGEAGSVITVVVMVQGNRPDLTVGRLIVPYASATGLTLALKNGTRHPRHVKVLFYDVAGNVVASSDRFVIPPHGSQSEAVASYISNGSFTAGSVEVIWVGYGPGRVFGQATVHDDLTGVDSITPMHDAGYRRIDPLDPTLKVGH
ncbi:MAG TPA: hypothetical protein VFV19_02080 [Candidatus Polarisedimenticolaceae bacterium]|nr:hypothetical protein [Candidatus Polarisedimenticolaceae bacterium]